MVLLQYSWNLLHQRPRATSDSRRDAPSFPSALVDPTCVLTVVCLSVLLLLANRSGTYTAGSTGFLIYAKATKTAHVTVRRGCTFCGQFISRHLIGRLHLLCCIVLFAAVRLHCSTVPFAPCALPAPTLSPCCLVLVSFTPSGDSK